MQAINPINPHILFRQMSGNQASGRWMADSGKSKNNMSTPQWGAGGHKYKLEIGRPLKSSNI